MALDAEVFAAKGNELTAVETAAIHGSNTWMRHGFIIAPLLAAAAAALVAWQPRAAPAPDPTATASPP